MPASQSDLLCMLERMQTRQLLNPSEQFFIAVCMPDQIQAGLINCRRISGSQNPDIMYVRLFRVSVALSTG